MAEIGRREAAERKLSQFAENSSPNSNNSASKSEDESEDRKLKTSSSTYILHTRFGEFRIARHYCTRKVCGNPHNNPK